MCKLLLSVDFVFFADCSLCSSIAIGFFGIVSFV